MSVSSMEQESAAVERFRTYLRIDSRQPKPDYQGVVEFLLSESKSIGLNSEVITLESGFPVVVMSWIGAQPELPSIMLNSHVDVVPVVEAKWTYPPLSAHMDDKGRIFARGAQDMKCVGSWYLEALRLLKDTFHPLRSIHCVFVPDEELGGKLGMKLFVKTAFYQSLNVGCALDEGIASPDSCLPVFYGERSPWWVRYTLCGPAGHGSQFLPNTSGQRLRRLLDLVMDYRSGQEAKLLDASSQLFLGDVTSVNLNMIDGGVQANVVPDQLIAVFDFRVTPHDCQIELEKQLHQWARQACLPDQSEQAYKIDFLQKTPRVGCSDINDAYWTLFRSVCAEMEIEIVPQIFPGATDSRYLRELGVSCINVSPIRNTPILLHDHDEFLPRDCFVDGIKFYEKVIRGLASLPSF